MTASSRAYEARRNGELVGFTTYKVERLLGRAAINLEVACVIPELHSTGLGYQMSARIVLRALVHHPLKGIYIASHILNPIALKGWMSRVIDPCDSFPHIGDVDPPSVELVSAALEFAHRHDPQCEFDKVTGVVSRKHLPGERIVPSCGVASIDEHFDRYVEPLRGDTVVMVLNVSPRVVVRHVRELRASVLRLAGAKLRRDVT